MIYEVVEKFDIQPSSLRDLSCQLVSEKVVESIWRGTLNFQSIYIPEPVERSLREWVGILPPLIQQDILDITVKGIIRSASRVTPYNSSTIPIIIASLAEVLYSPNMNSIEIWTDLHWNQEARMKLLHLLHSKQSGIKKMVFSCYKTPIFQFQELHYSERFLLMNILNKFTSLKTLFLPYVADDELLAKLGGGVCPELEQLSVEGSWGVTNQGLSALAGQDGGMVIGRAGWVPSHFAQCSEGQKLLGNILKGSPVTASQITSLMSRQSQDNGMITSLHQLNIKGTSADCRGLESVLQNFRHLRKLEMEEQHWQNLLVSAGCNDCFPKAIPLESINVTQHTYALLPTISRMFAQLRSLTVSNFSRSEAYLDGQDNLALLSNLPNLRELSLKDVELEEVYPALERVGHTLQTFRYGSRLKTVNVNKIAEVCPNLKTLSISNSMVLFTAPMVAVSPLSRLRNLFLEDVTFPSERQNTWKQMLHSSRCEHISLHNIRLTDGDISELVNRGTLASLEEIHISATFPLLLSEVSVYKLLDHCKQLVRIGGVCSWSIDDLVSLLDTVRSRYRFKIKLGEQD